MAPSTQRRQRSRAQWQLLIERAERSALSIAAFCQAEGVSTASFYAWRKRLAGSAQQAAAAVDGAPPPSRREPAMAGALSRNAEFFDLGTLAGVRPESSPWDLELALGAGVVLRLRRL